MLPSISETSPGLRPLDHRAGELYSCSMDTARCCGMILALVACRHDYRAAEPAACPASAVHAGPMLCIDRTEVTVAAYSKCVAAGACTLAGTAPTGNGTKDAVIGPLCNGNRADRQDHPINCVAWAQANAYCKWAHGRLPNEAEWELAAGGGTERMYPWGNDPPTAERVNACGSECAAMYLRTRGYRFTPMYATTDAFETTGQVGSFPAGASPIGALDMAGNVGEWVADWYQVDWRRVFRGGAWDQTKPEKLAITFRDAARLEVKSVIIGFRCAYEFAAR